MPFVPFHEFFPEVAKRETRSITAQPGSNLGVPPGEYGFMEMFCDEPDCDCRRVMFYVLSSARRDVEAVVAWGWEDRAFYARWFGMDDPQMVTELQGPILNLGSPQTRHAGALLRIVKEILLADPAYVERVKRHYALFREQIDQKRRGRAASGPKDPRGASQRSRARHKQRRRRP